MSPAKGLLVLPLLLAASLALRAAEAPSVTASLDPERLPAGQIATLRVEVRGGFEPRSAPTPTLGGFELVAGPSIEHRFEWINGRTSNSTILLYRLRALRPGAATVGPLRFTDASGTSLETPALAATVDRPDSGGSPRLAAASDPTLVARLDPPSPLQGQQAVWTLYLVTRGEAAQAEIKTLPDFRGFWAEDLDREQNVTPRVWDVGGVAWRAYPLMRKALFAHRAGALTIGPARAVAALRPDLFDIFSSSPFGETASVERESAPLAVSCRPVAGGGTDLPVGNFALKASLDRREVATGESATLSAILSGDGRLNDVASPQLSTPGIRVSEPEAKLSWKRSGARLTSVRQWQWILTPERSGSLEIAPLVVDVLDPATARLKRVESSTLALVAIAPPPAVTAPAAGAGAPRGEADRNRPGLTAVPAAAAVLAAAALLAVGFTLGRRKHARAVAEEAVSRHPSAENRVEAYLGRIASSAQLGRRAAARDELQALRRRFEEIRFGPQLSSREEAARHLEEDVVRLARTLNIRL